MIPSPPRWAELVLRGLLRPRDRDTVSGDLLEEYREVAVPVLGLGRARVWYLRQTLSLVTLAGLIRLAGYPLRSRGAWWAAGALLVLSVFVLLHQRGDPQRWLSAAAALSFDPRSTVTVRGRLAGIVFGARGSGGLIVVESREARKKYAFATAETREMVRQGFSRFSRQPGDEVIVTGELANGGQTIEGWTAARATRIAIPDGRVIFDRAAVGLVNR
jgi:hypothetical protein